MVEFFEIVTHQVLKIPGNYPLGGKRATVTDTAPRARAAPLASVTDPAPLRHHTPARALCRSRLVSSLSVRRAQSPETPTTTLSISQIFLVYLKYS